MSSFVQDYYLLYKFLQYGKYMAEIKVIFGLNTTADLTHPQLFIVTVDKPDVGHCKIIN